MIQRSNLRATSKRFQKAAYTGENRLSICGGIAAPRLVEDAHGVPADQQVLVPSGPVECRTTSSTVAYPSGKVHGMFRGELCGIVGRKRSKGMPGSS